MQGERYFKKTLEMVSQAKSGLGRAPRRAQRLRRVVWRLRAYMFSESGVRRKPSPVVPSMKATAPAQEALSYR